jgi:hypothetical protein
MAHPLLNVFLVIKLQKCSVTRKRYFIRHVFTHKETKKMAISLAVFMFNSQIESIWTAASS